MSDLTSGGIDGLPEKKTGRGRRFAERWFLAWLRYLRPNTNKTEQESAEALFGRLVRAHVLSLALSIVTVLCLIQSVFRALDPPRQSVSYGGADGRGYPVYPLREPVLSGDWVTRWAEATVLQAYAVDFYAYQAEFTAARRHFTSSGWRSFSESFVASGDFRKLVQGRLVGSAQAQAPPAIVSAGMIDGRYSWHIQFPMVATYQNGNDRVTERLMMNVFVVRLPVADHPDGMAIDRIEAVHQ